MYILTVWKWVTFTEIMCILLQHWWQPLFLLPFLFSQFPLKMIAGVSSLTSKECFAISVLHFFLCKALHSVQWRLLILLSFQMWFLYLADYLHMLLCVFAVFLSFLSLVITVLEFIESCSFSCFYANNMYLNSIVQMYVCSAGNTNHL